MGHEEVKLRFQCLKCGYCCRHLLSDTPHGRLGPFILPSERRWFPNDIISPLYAAGTKGRSRPRPKEIIVYQINKMTCSWLTEENTCQIYRHRPLVCRGYPIRMQQVHGECRFIHSNAADTQQVTLHKATVEEEEIADKRILAYLNLYLGKEELWVFPLGKKRWKKIKS